MKTKACLFSFIFFVFHFYIILIPTAGAATKIMPLGDSITWDDRGDDDRDDGEKVAYRYRLWQLLTNAGYEINFVGSKYTGYDIFPDAENEGHPGWRADEIVAGRSGSGEGKLSDWLIAEEPNIVLLHIGTNDISSNNENWNEVEAILVVIDDYESVSGKAVWVVLSLIIDRSCVPPLAPPCPKSLETTNFNNDVRDFVFFPRQAGGDNIILVNMQNDAGIDYHQWIFGGDMYDDLHPFRTGYAKMANLWFTALKDILPPINHSQSLSPPAGFRILP